MLGDDNDKGKPTATPSGGGSASNSTGTDSGGSTKPAKTGRIVTAGRKTGNNKKG